MICSRCSKKLTRKNVRQIDGKLVCSSCLFPKLKKGVPQ